VGAVFVFEEEEIKPWAPSLLKYVWQSVEDLRMQVRMLGGELIVRVGSADEEIPALAKQIGATRVLLKEELEWHRYHHLSRTINSAEDAGLEICEWVDALRPFLGSASDFPPPGTPYAFPAKAAPQPCFLFPEAASPLAALAKCTVPFGDMPPLSMVLGWAKGEESEDELNIQLMEAQRQALMQPEQVRMRREIDDTFVNLKAAVPATAPAWPEEPPEIPFRMPGGESSAHNFFEAWMNFYVATSNIEHQRMHQRVLEDKNTAFFHVFRSAIATGCLSTRHVYHACRYAGFNTRPNKFNDFCCVFRISLAK